MWKSERLTPPLYPLLLRAVQRAAAEVYIASDTPVRWEPLAEKPGGRDLETQRKIEANPGCLIETI